MSINYRERDWNTNLPYTRYKAIVESIYPHDVRSHAQNILENTEPGYKKYRYAAEFTRYVHQEIDYEPTEDIWRADFILDHSQTGDSVDQSALLGSLLASRSIPFRYVVVDKYGGRPHVVLQILFEDSDLEQMEKEADRFYKDVVLGVIILGFVTSVYFSSPNPARVFSDAIVGALLLPVFVVLISRITGVKFGR